MSNDASIHGADLCVPVCPQAKVSVSEAYAQLNALSDQPLLFIDHPVMITHNAADAAADAQWRVRDESMTEPGRVQALHLHQHTGNAAVPPDEALSQINYHLRNGHCKANWVREQPDDPASFRRLGLVKTQPSVHLFMPLLPLQYVLCQHGPCHAPCVYAG